MTFWIGIEDVEVEFVPGYGSTVTKPNILENSERTVTGCPILKGGGLHPPRIIWSLKAYISTLQLLRIERIIEMQQESGEAATIRDLTFFWTGLTASKNGRVVLALNLIPNTVEQAVYIETKGMLTLDSFRVLNRHAGTAAGVHVDLTVEEL